MQDLDKLEAEIYNSAHLFIEQYGLEAVEQALVNLHHYTNKKDHYAMMIWQDLIEKIVELQNIYEGRIALH